ncbi:MAG: M23 family metallopeptidase [Proteobacteria bacterium]|nr:M23 family metallopeptidase [Pseudomonadota bacterium]MBU1546859.1 M23 family metallopeptidase [Pseudomonadota bacterium]MBU2618873.1 M23 family metallopeptidase [Pseudomonadota bacterium]
MAEEINIFTHVRNICMASLLRICPPCLAALSRALARFHSNTQRQLVLFLNTAHFLTIGVSLALVVAFFLYAVDGRPIKGEDAYASEESEEFLPNVREIVGEIRPGDSLSSSFRSNGVDEEVRETVISAFDGVMDFRDMKPNDRYTLTLDNDGTLLKCLYESGPLEVHAIERTPEGSLAAKKLDVSLDCRTVKLRGKIESSLFAALAAFKEDAKLVYTFADIFASKIDFNTETRFGDTFELVVEKYYKNNEFVGYGKILVARYNSKEVGPLEGFYFDQGGKSAYFDHRGYELGESFIRSPIPMARVSSGFSYNRRHPVLDIVRPHLGIDLAAPMGTPIMATSDGRVKFAGWKGGYGKQIILDHGGGYQTYYGHLSRFANNIKAGAKVRQKQIIGYVGSTGMSTGPHLDYRMAQNGVFANPFNVKFRPRSQLSGTELVLFRQDFQSLTQLASSLDDPKIVVVKNVVVTPENPISML